MEDVISIDPMDLVSITRQQRNEAQDMLGLANATIRVLKKEKAELQEKFNQLQQQLTSEVNDGGLGERSERTCPPE